MTAALRALALLSIFASPLGLAEDAARTASPDASAQPASIAPSLHDIIASVSSRTGKRFLLDGVTTVLPLKSISAGQFVPILRPLMPQTAHLAAAIDRNALVIVDRADNVHRIAEMAKALDRLPVSSVPVPISSEAKAK